LAPRLSRRLARYVLTVQSSPSIDGRSFQRVTWGDERRASKLRWGQPARRWRPLRLYTHVLVLRPYTPWSGPSAYPSLGTPRLRPYTPWSGPSAYPSLGTLRLRPYTPWSGPSAYPSLGTPRLRPYTPWSGPSAYPSLGTLRLRPYTPWSGPSAYPSLGTYHSARTSPLSGKEVESTGSGLRETSWGEGLLAPRHRRDLARYVPLRSDLPALRERG